MKKKILIIFFFIILIKLFLNADKLTILWWNINNLFDTINDPLKEDIVLTNIEYNDKIVKISKKIKSINADLIGLAEVENIEILRDIANLSTYSFYYLIEGNDPRGIDICLLSKWKLNYISHKDLPVPYKEDKNYKFSRDCSEASFYFNGEKIYILLNHLKSQIGDKEKSFKKQKAQVKGILDIIYSIYKKNSDLPNIIIMGDFNTQRFTEPLNILEKSDLKIINYLFNEKKVYTYKKGEFITTLDYFILNDILYNKVKIKKLKIFKTREFKNISDHFPLLLEFDL